MEFRFKHGTCVEADSEQEAVDLLSSISWIGSGAGSGYGDFCVRGKAPDYLVTCWHDKIYNRVNTDDIDEVSIGLRGRANRVLDSVEVELEE